MSQRKSLSSQKSDSVEPTSTVEQTSAKRQVSPGTKALIQTFLTPVATVVATTLPDIGQMASQVKRPVKQTYMSIAAVMGWKTLSGSVKANAAGHSTNIKAGIENRLGDKEALQLDGVPEDVRVKKGGSSSLISLTTTISVAGGISALSSHFPSTLAAIKLANPNYYDSLQQLSLSKRFGQVYRTGLSTSFIRENTNVAVYVMFFDVMRKNIDQHVPAGFGFPVTLGTASLTSAFIDTGFAAVRYNLIQDFSLHNMKAKGPGFLHSASDLITTQGFYKTFTKGLPHGVLSTGLAFGAIQGVDYLVNKVLFPEDSQDKVSAPMLSRAQSAPLPETSSQKSDVFPKPTLTRAQSAPLPETAKKSSTVSPTPILARNQSALFHSTSTRKSDGDSSPAIQGTPSPTTSTVSDTSVSIRQKRI